MPTIDRPDGAAIYYEVRGSGFPLLLFAPGGVNSQVSFWPNSAINPFDYADEFMVIGMDQRNAERSPAPLVAPSWTQHFEDQAAVLDELGVERTLLWGGCIGVGYVMRFIMGAAAVAGAVGQGPDRLRRGVNSRETFFAMFRPAIDLARSGGMQAVVASAIENPTFMRNNAAGPFAARIAADPAFRAEALALDPSEYERIIRAYDEHIRGVHHPFMSVPESFVRGARRRCSSCPATTPSTPRSSPSGSAARRPCPLPGRGLPLPEKIDATKQTIRAFLRQHAH
ncbi:MAG: alpha/beta hydrolase [Dehalococcoidia bacterium]